MGIDAEMFIKYVGEKPTETQLKKWSWDLCTAIGAEHFFINPKEGRAALQLSRVYSEDGSESDFAGKLWQQDGPDIIANDKEWFISVSLCTRYYGVGYERGDYKTIVATAQWLEQNIGGEVWYGGDSSGACASLFDKSAREELMRHALSPNGRDYYRGFDRGPYPTPEPCGLCVPDRGMNRFGWGAHYIAVSCSGCGRCFTSRDDGKTWQQDKEV